MARQSKTQTLSDVHAHQVNLNTREVYIHSYYSKDDETEPGVDYRQATTFIKNLHILDIGEDPKPVLIHMQSDGGCWDNGMAMFNAIEYARSYTTILAYSQASSMSGILLQSASLRVMMPDCHFLMHFGDIGYASHPMAFKAVADFQIIACKRMLEIFAKRAYETGSHWRKRKSYTEQSAYNYFEKKLEKKVDWYIDAREAVDLGLADQIVGDKEYPNTYSLLGG
jgi:ATP-dependent protease ClpP protease subunit